MVAVFAPGYAFLAAMLTLLFHMPTRGALRAGVAVLSGRIRFYFHRNDLLDRGRSYQARGLYFCSFDAGGRYVGVDDAAADA